MTPLFLPRVFKFHFKAETAVTPPKGISFLSPSSTYEQQVAQLGCKWNKHAANRATSCTNIAYCSMFPIELGIALTISLTLYCNCVDVSLHCKSHVHITTIAIALQFWLALYHRFCWYCSAVVLQCRYIVNHICKHRNCNDIAIWVWIALGNAPRWVGHANRVATQFAEQCNMQCIACYRAMGGHTCMVWLATIFIIHNINQTRCNALCIVFVHVEYQTRDCNWPSNKYISGCGCNSIATWWNKNVAVSKCWSAIGTLVCAIDRARAAINENIIILINFLTLINIKYELQGTSLCTLC